ncbi:iron response transcriptional regulator IrrA [Bradyrhizobium sp. UFLA05-153]
MDARSTNGLADAPEAALSELSCDDGFAENSAKVCMRRLRDAGLRATRRRVLLAQLLFARSDRHVTAEILFNEAIAANIKLSIATVYNTLNQFTQAGLLRRIRPNSSRTFFDTDTRTHPHFYLVGEEILIDVPEKLLLGQMPETVLDHEISRIDIIVHIRRRLADI